MTAPLATVTVDRRRGGPTVATVAGEIDLTNAEEIDGVLDVAAEGSADLVVDLVDVVYLDSHGVRVLQRLAKRHQSGALRVSVVAARRGVVRDLLDITRLGDVLTVLSERP